jgi:hypothetical protein
MKLESAHQLKEELLLGIAERVRVRGDKSVSPIAIGIAPPARRGEFRIAVRPRSARDLAGIREYIDDRTAGEMEIRVTGAIQAAGTAALCMGASISRTERQCRTGSLGFFALRNRDGAVGFVSNNHILAAEDAGRDGDLIVHPGKADRRCADPAGIARLDGDYPRLRGDAFSVDCAFAQLIDERNLQPQFLGEPTVAMSNLAVTKNGRSTGQTHGRVSAFSLDRCRVDYEFGSTEFQGQIEIESVIELPFASGGDSGSLILTEEGHPVGLLHSVSAAGGRTNNSGLTFANPIQSVLDALDVSFLL